MGQLRVGSDTTVIKQIPSLLRVYYYWEFMTSTYKYSFVKVGDVFETKYSGSVEVIALSGTMKFFVRFLDTGSTIQVTGKLLTSGLLREWSVPVKDSVGKAFETPNYGTFKIVNYSSCTNVTIRFEDTGYTTTYSASQIKSGDMKDPLVPTYMGVGYLGIGPYNPTENKLAHCRWMQMIRRCHSEDDIYKSYEETTVYKEWFCFQDFARWAEVQRGFYIEDAVWHLDKDLLVSGSKEYGPDSCCFLPQRINCMIGRAPVDGYYDSKNNDYGFGYTNTDGTNYKRRFKSQEDGKLWYKENKERVVKEVADQYKNVLDSRVYEALYSWQVN